MGDLFDLYVCRTCGLASFFAAGTENPYCPNGDEPKLHSMDQRRENVAIPFTEVTGF